MKKLASFLTFAGQSCYILIVLRASGLKVPARKPREEPPERRLLKTSNAKNCLPTGIEPAAFGLPVHCSTTGAREDASSHA